MALTPVQLTKLQSWLVSSGIQDTNNALYQVINQLIVAINGINNAVGSINDLVGPAGPPGRDGLAIGFALDSGSGGDGGGDTLVVPGPAGTPGINGTTGAQGPIGPVIIVEDGLDGQDGLNIPVQGPQGIQGNAGRDGINAIFFPEDGIDGLDGFPGIPGPQGGSGSPAWTLVAHSAPTAVNHADFTGLSAYTDIRVLIRLITYAAGDITVLRVSTDNGATFLSAATDYRSIVVSGQESGVGNVSFYGIGATAGRSGEILIEGFNLTSPKVARSNPDMTVMPSTSAFNALQVLSAGTQNFTGGDIYVFGR